MPAEREPLAQPADHVLVLGENLVYILVGVMLAVGAPESKSIYGKYTPAFRNAMTEIGVLGGVILLIAVANFLIRRKEREPTEEEEPGAEAE